MTGHTETQNPSPVSPTEGSQPIAQQAPFSLGKGGEIGHDSHRKVRFHQLPQKV